MDRTRKQSPSEEIQIQKYKYSIYLLKMEFQTQSKGNFLVSQHHTTSQPHVQNFHSNMDERQEIYSTVKKIKKAKITNAAKIFEVKKIFKNEKNLKSI